MIRKNGNYTNINVRNPRAIGYCDITGFPTEHNKLIKQYMYISSGLQWTGLLVHPDFADDPNPQGLLPPIKADPYPLQNPRPNVPGYTSAQFTPNNGNPYAMVAVTGGQPSVTLGSFVMPSNFLFGTNIYLGMNFETTLTLPTGNNVYNYYFEIKSGNPISGPVILSQSIAVTANSSQPNTYNATPYNQPTYANVCGLTANETIYVTARAVQPGAGIASEAGNIILYSFDYVT